MNDNFDRIMEFILKQEGGYINDIDDPGGETNFGISKSSFPNEDIKNMTQERAKEIHRSLYWNAIKGDNLTWPIDLYAMDAAVNMGVGTALRLAKSPDFIHARLKRYLEITSKHTVLKKYLWGWIKRTLDCQEVGNG